MPYFIDTGVVGCSGWALLKENGDIIGCHTNKQDAIDHMVAISLAEGIRPGGQRADAPAPPSDQLTGSETNPSGSAGGKSGGIVLSAATVTALENKTADHNKLMTERDRPSWTRVTVGALKAVYRRGAGAYSSSHRPGIGRAQWAMARVNAFLFLARTGAPENSKYIGDNDLLNKSHPKYSESTNSVRALPENYRPALSPDVPEGRACGNCYFYDESNVQGDKAWCERWDDYVDGAYYCNAWQPDENTGDGEETYVMPEARAIDVPQFLQDNARRGLDWLNEGFAGDGVTDKTISEARQMSRGIISEDKAARMGPWFARHMSDLTGTDRNTNPPTAGMVAHALWGGWPVQESRRAMDWAETQVMNVEENGRHMTNKIETRRVTINDFDIRESGDGMSFAGYAAVFDSPSEPLPFLETIRAGAFAKSLKSRNNVMMLWSHDTSQPLASTRSKTMRLYEDTRGLMVEADLPQTSLGRDVSELLRARVVDSMSFGFSVPRNGDIWSADGMTRELVEVRLHEVSVVAFPAYAKTSASVRSLDVLADRIGADASVLSSALDALESGDTLTRDQATLLASVVDTLSPDADPVQELVTDFDVKVKLAVLKDMIDLTYKSL